MTVHDLKINLVNMDVSEKAYSLEGEMNCDTIVLFWKYNIWEVSYVDDRGKKNTIKEFLSEAEACEYIYTIFKDAKNIEGRFNLNT